jgi:hypothetical protein
MKFTSLSVVLAALGGTNAFVGSLRIPLGFSIRTVAASVSSFHNNNNNNNNNNNKADDLFDPLLSPHAYPNGVDAGPVTEKQSNNNTTPPKKKKPFGFRTNGEDFEPTNNSISFHNNPQQSSLQPINVFDPTISPHRYPNGTPDRVVDLSAPNHHKIGILLMDHGSRNSHSNQRLQDLAQLYQSRLSSSCIVRAAHMEIAEPSIPQVLRQFVLEDQVDQIICHPYFLSPGRHVTQDIPQIVQQAIIELSQEVNELPPIVTTDPVGAQTDVMIAAIHNLVQQSVTVPKG